MRQSKIEIYLHFVWATYRRVPLLEPEIERKVHRFLHQETARLGADVLALNGMPDHVHLLVKMPSTLAPALLMKQIKALSAQFAHDHLPVEPGYFWQSGYAVLSVTPSQRGKVVEYIKHQKQHHAENSVHPRWEEVDEEYPLSSE